MTPKDLPAAEFRLKQINTIIATCGAVGAIMAIFFGFRNLANQSKAQTEATKSQTRSIEEQWAQKFYEERMTIYRRATEAAARIATLKSMDAGDDQLREPMEQFHTLFWGPMCITEGDDVERAMVKFKAGLDTHISPRKLEQMALCLAHICKNETRVFYKIEPSKMDSYGTNEQLLAKMQELLAP
jgi:hypothetical protein